MMFSTDLKCPSLLYLFTKRFVTTECNSKNTALSLSIFLSFHWSLSPGISAYADGNILFHAEYYTNIKHSAMRRWEDRICGECQHLSYSNSFWLHNKDTHQPDTNFGSFVFWWRSAPNMMHLVKEQQTVLMRLLVTLGIQRYSKHFYCVYKTLKIL
jgi:hypothetical protein